MKYFFLFIAIFLNTTGAYSQNSDKKVKIGVAGMTHGHVNWILNQMQGENYIVVGISESNDILANRLLDQYKIDKGLRYNSLKEMLTETSPDAVVAFNSIFEHLEVVEECAPKGIHVMVEKPLAVNPAHAQRMSELAIKNDILLLTNYETTWYGTTRELMKEVLNNDRIGEIRKIVVRDGHMGPQEIGVNEEFLEWLTDPQLNGGGALIDFGCYGANLITKLMRNQRPVSVTAVTQQIKPQIYPEVDDEATIIVTYPEAQGIIQASWNWPIHRKDLDVYGTKGIINQYNRSDMEIRTNGKSKKIETEDNSPPDDDPFTYFSAAVLKDKKVGPDDLSSLENNLIVVEILDAARRSSKTGKTIYLE